MRYKAFISYSHAADGKLAPALESALRKFAQPWYRPRSVKVFRDQANLAASPGLWSSIEKALNESEYFLLLASRQSAGSQWVRREVDHWLKHRSSQKLLIILTDGEVVWDARGGDFDWNKTNALPENLAKAFTEEPLYLDFRWAKTVEDLSLNNPRFLDQIAALASPLHGRPKEDLIGEDVLEHRRTKRWAWSAAIVLVILTSLFGLSALIALDQKNKADRQRAQALGLQLAAQAEAKRIQQPNLLQTSVADAVKAMRQSYSDEAYKTLQVGLKLLPTPAGGEKHDDNVTAVVFSPDGRFVATASYDHTSLIFEVPARRKAAPLRLNHQGVVWVLDFSRDGKYLATASWDGFATVWEVSSGKHVARLPHGNNAVTAVVFSPDGRFVATASEDKTARVWEWAAERETAHLTHKDNVNGVAFSLNGKFLVTVSDDTTARVWEPASGQQIKTIEHRTGVTALAFSRDGNSLATATRDGIAQVWEVTSGRKISDPMKHEGVIWSLSFSPNGKYLATASRDKTARLWELPNGKQVARLEHEDFIWKIAFSADGKYVATASRDRTARVWEVPSGAEIRRMIHQDNVTGVSFSPDGKSLATASDDNTAQVWELRPVTELAHKAEVKAITANADGKTLATASLDLTARTWEMASGLEKKKTALQYKDIVGILAFSPDGSQLATARWDGTAHLWNISAGARLCLNCKNPEELEDQDNEDDRDKRLTAAVFSSDGRFLAAAGNQTTQVWTVPGGSPISRPVKHEEGIQALAFSLDGKYLAAAGEKTTSVWEVSSGKKIASMPDAGSVTSVAFSSKGKYLVTAKERGTIDLWELPSGRHVRCLDCNEETPTNATAVTFSPDDNHVAAADVSGTARLWNAASGKKIGQILPGEGLDTLAFSPDRKYLLMVSKDHRAQALLLWPEDLISDACKRLTVLTCEQPASAESAGFFRSFASSSVLSLWKSFKNSTTSVSSKEPSVPLELKPEVTSPTQASKQPISYAVAVSLNGKPVNFVASKDGSEVSRRDSNRPELILTPGKYALRAGTHEIKPIFAGSCTPPTEVDRIFEKLLDDLANAKNANFYFANAAGDFDLRYNSRSLYDGPFGFGWTFETRIERTPDGNLVIHEVDDYASEYGGPTGLYESTTPFPSVIAEEPGRLIRHIRNAGYENRYGPRVTMEVFDSQGRLRSVRFADGKAEARRNNNAERLSSIVNQWTGKTIYAFERDALGRHILGLRDSAGGKLTFEYEGNRLVKKPGPNGAVQSYRYDERLNLVEFKQANTELKLGYDTLRDYVVSAQIGVTASAQRLVTDYDFKYGSPSPEHDWTIRSDGRGNFVRWDYYKDRNETVKTTVKCLEATK